MTNLMQIFVYFSSTCFGLIRPSSGAIECQWQRNAPPARTLLKTPSCTKDTIWCICKGNYKFYWSWRWAYKPETCRAKINKYLHQVGHWLLFQTKCKVQPSKKQAVWSYREPIKPNHVLPHLMCSSDVPLRPQGSLFEGITLFWTWTPYAP